MQELVNTNPPIADEKLRRFFAVFFLSLFFAYPLSTFVTMFLVPSGSNVISILARAWVFVLGLNAIYLNLKWNQFHRPASFVLFVFFWSIYSTRIIYDTTVNTDELGSSPFLYYSFAIVLSFITCIGCFTKVAFWKWRYFNISLLITLAALNVLLLYNVITTPSDYIIDRGFRFEGNERLNPITSGMLASFLLVFIAVQLYYDRLNWKNSIFYLTLAAIGMVNLAVTLSKGPIFFTLLALLLIISRLFGQRKMKPILWLAASILLVLLVMGYFGLLDIFSLVLERFSGIGEKDESTAERLMLYSNAWKQFQQSPFLGDFLEERVLKIYPHNMVLESLMALGVAGGIMFVTYFVVSGYKIVKVLLRTQIAIVPLIVFYGFISSMISGSLSMGPELWYCFAFAHVLYYHYKERVTALEVISRN